MTKPDLRIAVVGAGAIAQVAHLPLLQKMRGARLLGLGIVLNRLAGAAYIGAGLGPGPRDGLMAGLVARTGGSVRVVSTSIEIVVLAIGWSIGGVAGIGTLLYASTIGWLLHHFLPILTVARVEKAQGISGPE